MSIVAIEISFNTPFIPSHVSIIHYRLQHIIPTNWEAYWGKGPGLGLVIVVLLLSILVQDCLLPRFEIKWGNNNAA